MRRIKLALIAIAALIPLSLLQARAQSSAPATVQISGVVQSFSAGVLDIKPATSPAVWVMVPADLKLDRGRLKAGAQVSAEAYWSDVSYIATQVSIK